MKKAEKFYLLLFVVFASLSPDVTGVPCQGCSCAIDRSSCKPGRGESGSGGSQPSATTTGSPILTKSSTRGQEDGLSTITSSWTSTDHEDLRRKVLLSVGVIAYTKKMMDATSLCSDLNRLVNQTLCVETANSSTRCLSPSGRQDCYTELSFNGTSNLTLALGQYLCQNETTLDGESERMNGEESESTGESEGDERDEEASFRVGTNQVNPSSAAVNRQNFQAMRTIITKLDSIGLKLVRRENAKCVDGEDQVYLGESVSRRCPERTMNRQFTFNQYCVLNGCRPVLVNDQQARCPSIHTQRLENLQTILNNRNMNREEIGTELEQLEETVSGAVQNNTLGVVDVTLVSDILDQSLELFSPRRQEARRYVSVFNRFSSLNQTLLRSAHRNNKTVERLINTIERFGYLVDLENETSWTLTESDVHMAVKQVEDADLSYSLDFNQVSVEIPRVSLNKQRNDSRIQLVVFQKRNLFEALSETDSTNETLASWVVSASVGNQRKEGLNTEVKIYLPHSASLSGHESVSCNFWDWEIGGWSTVGVETKRKSENITLCETDHLTNFALLLDVNTLSNTTISPEHVAILSVISYTGCAVSAFCLILTLAIYIAFRRLRKDNPSKILMNLCAALLLLNGVFLGLTHFKDDPIVCKITAVLLHYSLLASFSWMAVEAFYMYIALVLVFSYIKHFMLKVMIVGWGIPALVVVITLAISLENYSLYEGQLCWLDPTAFFGAVLAPVALVLLVNTIAFALVIYKMYLLRRTKSYADPKTANQQNSVAAQLRGALAIFVLLGLTWIFAAFLVLKNNIVFNYLFAIFNSLQGFFLFLFYCAFKRDVALQCRRSCWRDRMKDTSSQVTSKTKFASGSVSGK